MHQRGRGEQGDAKLDGQVPRKQALPEPHVFIGKFGRAPLIAQKRFSRAVHPKCFLEKLSACLEHMVGKLFLTGRATVGSKI